MVDLAFSMNVFSNLDTFFFLILLHRLAPPVQHLTDGVTADVINFFLISSSVTESDVSYRSFMDALYHVEEFPFCS